MRAMIVHDPGPRSRLEWAYAPDPTPGEGEVLVAVHATALNRADLMQRAGKYPPPPGVSSVLGLELAGHIHALGPGVSGWSVGDRVCSLVPGGSYAELAVVPSTMLMKVPPNMSLTTAAAVPEAFLTAYSALFDEGQAHAGNVVLIHAGASGVGTAAIQMARQAGCRVLTTVGGPEKAQACRELGAELAIDRHTEDFEVVVAEHIGEAGNVANVGPGGAGPSGPVDVIIDMVGKDYFERNLRLLKVQGRLVFVAAQSGRDVEMKITALTAKRLSLVGTTLRARSPAEKGELARNFLNRFGHDLSAGRIAPVIDRTYRIEEAEEAHAHMADNRNIGKIVLQVIAGERSSTMLML